MPRRNGQIARQRMTRPDRIRRVASVALRDDPFQHEKVAQAERVISRACSA